jgi:ankyrin repeat protein
MSRSTSSFAVLAIAIFVCASSQAEDSAEDTPADKLISAAYDGDFTAVKSLLSAGTDVNAKNRSGKRALYYATFQGHDDIASFLIERGAAIETTGGTYYGTTLMNAASSHCVKTLRLLLRRGVRTNTKDEKGWTTLMLAAHKNDIETVRLLVEHRGTRLNLRNWGGYTALHCAAWSNALEVVQYLLHCGADPTIKDNADCTALDDARYHSTCSWEGEAFTDKAKKIMTLLQLPAVSSPKSSTMRFSERLRVSR